MSCHVHRSGRTHGKEDNRIHKLMCWTRSEELKVEVEAKHNENTSSSTCFDCVSPRPHVFFSFDADDAFIHCAKKARARGDSIGSIKALLKLY
jgi:hypothetical protein